MNQIWYIAINGKQRGPFNEEDVRTLIRSSKIDSDAYVFKTGTDEWTPITEQPEFLDHFVSAAPPPPPPPPPPHKRTTKKDDMPADESPSHSPTGEDNEGTSEAGIHEPHSRQGGWTPFGEGNSEEPHMDNRGADTDPETRVVDPYNGKDKEDKEDDEKKSLIKRILLIPGRIIKSILKVMKLIFLFLLPTNLEGEARHINGRSEQTSSQGKPQQVLNFRVERHVKKGRLRPVPVELRGQGISDYPNEGDVVKIRYFRWQSQKPLRVSKIHNATTGSKIKVQKGSLILRMTTNFFTTLLYMVWIAIAIGIVIVLLRLLS